MHSLTKVQHSPAMKETSYQTCAYYYKNFETLHARKSFTRLFR